MLDPTTDRGGRPNLAKRFPAGRSQLLLRKARRPPPVPNGRSHKAVIGGTPRDVHGEGVNAPPRVHHRTIFKRIHLPSCADSGMTDRVADRSAGRARRRPHETTVCRVRSIHCPARSPRTGGAPGRGSPARRTSTSAACRTCASASMSATGSGSRVVRSGAGEDPCGQGFDGVLECGGQVQA